jgi:hypothetical protein
MKTAEEWYNEKEMAGCENADGDLQPYEFTIDDFKQIQLDAIKEGMRRAARQVYGTHVRATTPEMVEFNSGVKQTKDKVEQAILSAAEQLTEKDLL